MNIVLLLTATIVPQVKHKISLTNPKERLREYVNAINWYYEHTPYKIIIGENSGFYELLKHIKYQDESRIEFICFKNEDFVDSAGWNEWDILRKVKNKSKFINEASFVYKITGRLILENILQISTQFTKINHSFFCGNFASDFQSMDTRTLVFTPDLYEGLLDVQKLIGKYYLEIVIMDFVHKQYNKDKNTILYYKYPLFIKGRSGHYGSFYDTPLWKKPLRYIWKSYKLYKWNQFKREHPAIEKVMDYL